MTFSTSLLSFSWETGCRCCWIILTSPYSPSPGIQSLPLPLSTSRLARVGIDPMLREVFCVCNDVVGFVLTPYLSPRCSEGEHDLANVLPACQAVGGRQRCCVQTRMRLAVFLFDDTARYVKWRMYKEH